MIPILIVRYKMDDMEHRCIQTINLYTDLQRAEVVIQDNGVLNQPLGIVWNEMIESYKGWDQDDPIGVLLNTDCFVTPNWIEKLFSVIRSSPDIGFVGPTTNNTQSNQRVDDNYVPENYVGQVAFGHMLSGFCLMFRRQAWEDAGRFPEDSPFYGQETALIWSANRKQGWRTAIVKDCWVKHLGSASVDAAVSRGEMNYETERKGGREWFLRYQMETIVNEMNEKKSNRARNPNY